MRLKINIQKIIIILQKRTCKYCNNLLNFLKMVKIMDINILTIALIQFQQIMFSLTLFSTLYQFIINKHNQIYSLNISLSSVLYLLLSIIFIDGQFQDKCFFTYQIHEFLQLIIFFVLYTDISYVSYNRLIKRLTEQTFKISLSVMTGIYVLLDKNIYFDYTYLTFISFITVYILYSLKLTSKQQIIRIIKNISGIQLFYLIVITGYKPLNIYLQIIFAIYQYIWLKYYFNAIWRNKLN